MIVVSGGVDDPQVLALLDLHVTRTRAETARASDQALDTSGLGSPEISFWAVWDEGTDSPNRA
jgi:putative acetyltransferase